MDEREEICHTRLRIQDVGESGFVHAINAKEKRLAYLLVRNQG